MSLAKRGTAMNLASSTTGWGPQGFLKTQLNKVFPDHWSFMLGEIALYSFIILLLTGVYLSFFFQASPAETVYNGSYVPLKGVTVTQAYASTLDISFDVRAGLVMRQIHHWAPCCSSRRSPCTCAGCSSPGPSASPGS